MADAAAVEDVDFTKLPIDERCQHKNWKARVSGYEDLHKLFQQQDDEKSPEFHKYAWILRKFPVDSNAAAQEKGLLAVSSFVELAAPVTTAKIASELMSGIISKCLMSPKARTKELAQEIILMLIEVERHELVTEELIKGLDNKAPKIVTTCITILRIALASFGPKIMKPSPLIKYITSKGLEDRDKIVRDESKQLAVEIYRWMKDAFKSQLNGLKPVTLSELETEFEKVAGDRPSPSRYLRSEQERIPVTRGDAVPGDDNPDAGPAAEVEEIDPYELLEPVDIMSKLPSDFYSNCESKKWQERKQALDSLQELLTPNPKITLNSDYGDIVKILKKFIQKDTMIPVVASAAKCLADLANRLKKHFSPYAHSCISICLEKFKEKKSNVVTALRECIDACMCSYSLENILEDLSSALDNKNPQIKAETASFLTRQFSTHTFAILGNKKLLKQLIDPLIKTLSDMDASVRDASAEAIGTAMKVVGEKLISPLLSDVDPIKMAKINEFYEKAVVKYPAPAGGHPVARAVTAPAAARQQPAAAPAAAAAVSSKPSASASKAKPVATIVNKGVSTKGIKSKTDCGRAKTAGPIRSNVPAAGATARVPASSVDDLSEESDAPIIQREIQSGTVTKKPIPLKSGKSIIPPKSAAPKIAAARSKTDCGLRKNASAPALDKPAIPVPKSKIGTGLRKPGMNGNSGAASASNLPSASQRSFTRSQSPLDERRSEEVDDEYSQDEEEEEPVIQHSAVRASRIIAATPIQSKIRPQVFGSGAGGYEPSPIPGQGYYMSPRSATDSNINVMLADWNDPDHDVALMAVQKTSQLLKTEQAVSLLSKVDQIIYASVMKYRICRSLFLDDPNALRVSIELYNKISEVLDLMFKQESLGKRASIDALKELMPTLLDLVIDTRMSLTPEGQQITRMINILGTAILSAADQTNMLCALLKCLHSCVTISSGSSDYKPTEMVMKCIWKLVRNLPNIIPIMNIDVVLFDLHAFWRDFPKKFWDELEKKMSSQQQQENNDNGEQKKRQHDVPFRTVKTVIYMIVQQKGRDVYDHLTLIPNPGETEIGHYIDRLLKDSSRLHAAAATAAGNTSAQSHLSHSHVQPADRTGHNLSNTHHSQFQPETPINNGVHNVSVRDQSYQQQVMENGGNKSSMSSHHSSFASHEQHLQSPASVRNLSIHSTRSPMAAVPQQQQQVHTPGQRQIPRLPPAEQITVASVCQWMDEASRVSGSAADLKRNSLSNLERHVATFGTNEQENLMKARAMAMDARMSVDQLKKKYSINI